MTKTKRKIPVGWIACALLVVLGVLIWVCLVGYEFSACICFGCAAVLACYLLLPKLGKKHKKLARVLCIVLSGCLGIGLVVALITGIRIGRACAGSDVRCDYVVVLGAGVNGTTPSLSLKNRIDGAYAYLTRYPEAVCVVSGGQGYDEDISEAECMYRELTAMGIAPERIWLEEQATDTRENIRFSLDIIEANTGARPTEIGLVSSEYHLYRAGLLARTEGVTAYGIPAKTTWLSLRVNYFLREIAAVWYHTILGGI